MEGRVAAVVVGQVAEQAQRGAQAAELVVGDQVADAGGAVHPRAAELFYSLYFGMTGLHALHMVIGIAVLAALLRPSWKGRYGPGYNTPVECVGLYWHFVDIVWIFLFPLLYLIGRH